MFHSQAVVNGKSLMKKLTPHNCDWTVTVHV